MQWVSLIVLGSPSLRNLYAATRRRYLNGGDPGCIPGEARRCHLSRAGTQRRVGTRRVPPEKGSRRAARTDAREQLGTEAR